MFIILTERNFTKFDTPLQTLTTFYNRANGYKLQNTPGRCLLANLKSYSTVGYS